MILLYLLTAYLFATVKQRTTRVMGKAFIEKLFSLDHKFHTNRETGSLLKGPAHFEIQKVR